MAMTRRIKYVCYLSVQVPDVFNAYQWSTSAPSIHNWSNLPTGYGHACFEWRKEQPPRILQDAHMFANSNQSANQAFESNQRVQFPGGRALRQTSGAIEKAIIIKSNT